MAPDTRAIPIKIMDAAASPLTLRQRLPRLLGSLLGLVLFLGALWVLQRTLEQYHYQDMVDYLRTLPAANIAAALLLTVASYLVMTAYDLLALRYIRRRLDWRRTLFASFISYAFSNTIGLSVLTSGSVRFRLYSAWGLSALEITKVVLFSTLTLWLGVLVCGGLVLLVEPLHLPEVLRLPVSHSGWLGALLLIPPAGWLLLGSLRREPFRLGSWELPVVRPHLALRQLVVGGLDWVLAGAVLYVLLPRAETLGFGHFLAVFLVAQITALASHVPGGLGVFESVVIFLLAPKLAASEVLGGLLAFRLVYYLLPLLAATLALGVHESLRLHLGWLPRLLGPWLPALLPPTLALMTLFSGAILLFSVATPAAEWRLAWLEELIPLPVLELSHFLGSLVGMSLLLLARGLQRRLDAAWLLTVILLAAGCVAALLKGGDFEEATILALLLAVLLPCHRHFYRKTSLLSEPFTPAWLLAIGLVALSAGWLGFFAYRHVAYSNALWWQFSFGGEGEAPRFLRALVGSGALVLFFALAKLLRPARPQPALPSAAELERAATIIAAYPRAPAHLALLGDKDLLFSENGDGFLMYGIEGRSWVVMGDPVASDPELRRELAWRFRELCEEYDGWPVFYQVRHDQLDLYLELGLTLLKIGEEARVDLAAFTLEGKAKGQLRTVLRKLEREGCRFEVVPAAAVPTLLPQLRQVSDAWLAAKNAREKGFSLGRFDATYLARGPMALVWREEHIIAFANLWCGGGEELAIDLMRHLPGTPNGTMDYLFTQAILWGKAQGYAWFSLGMAPLAGLHSRSLAPLWNRFGSLVFGRGERFYNFRGVRQYKDKFGPIWEPRYLAVPGGIALPRILVNLTSLIAGGLQGVVPR